MAQWRSPRQWESCVSSLLAPQCPPFKQRGARSPPWRRLRLPLWPQRPDPTEYLWWRCKKSCWTLLPFPLSLNCCLSLPDIPALASAGHGETLYLSLDTASDVPSDDDGSPVHSLGLSSWRMLWGVTSLNNVYKEILITSFPKMSRSCDAVFWVMLHILLPMVSLKAIWKRKKIWRDYTLLESLSILLQT